MELTFARAGKVRLKARVPFRRINTASSWRLATGRPIPAAWAAGRYKACVRVWDRAGNVGTSCARYIIY